LRKITDLERDSIQEEDVEGVEEEDDPFVEDFWPAMEKVWL